MSELSDRLYAALVRLDTAHDAILLLDDSASDQAFREARREYRHAYNAMVDEIEATEKQSA